MLATLRVGSQCIGSDCILNRLHCESMQWKINACQNPRGRPQETGANQYVDMEEDEDAYKRIQIRRRQQEEKTMG